MARRVLTAMFVVLLAVLVGCRGVDTGASQLVPRPPKAASAVKAVDASETDIIEEVTRNRQAYRNTLEFLIAHYKKTGNDMKLKWAKDEMKRLNKVPQYVYIIEASVAPANLRATTSIAEAELIYIRARRLERAKKFYIFTRDNNLRLALRRYNQLIRKHPSSDRIDDAAYRAGRICEHFKDYTIAILYYQRAYQWDPKTAYPARYRRARILDEHMHRRVEALKLYQESLKKEKLSKKRKEFIEERIIELTKSDESLEESK